MRASIVSSTIFLLWKLISVYPYALTFTSRYVFDDDDPNYFPNNVPTDEEIIFMHKRFTPKWLDWDFPNWCLKFFSMPIWKVINWTIEGVRDFLFFIGFLYYVRTTSRFKRKITPKPKNGPLRTPAPTIPPLFNICRKTSKSDWSYNHLCSFQTFQIYPQPEWYKIYPECAGNMQSPINIIEQMTYSNCARDIPAGGIFVFDAGNCLIRDTIPKPDLQGWKIVAKKHCTKPSVRVDGRTFELEKIEFHYQSEHKLDEQNFDGEIQFVHFNIRNPTDRLILSVFMKIDGNFETYTDIDYYFGPLAYFAMRYETGQGSKYPRKLPLLTSKWNPYKIMPQSGSYYTYMGSLTKPPCTENVR